MTPRAANRPDLDLMLRFYTRMQRIRRFEETALYHSTIGHVYGPLHLYIGQEASGVGICAALEDRDCIASTHRGHGHSIAKGTPLAPMFAELFGRATGLCHGKGGSQHVADFSRGVLGANGIVGSSFGLAAGAALRGKLRGNGAVAVAFFGDGAASRGTLHEVLNIAALWGLPLIFACEHNEYAQWVPAAENIACARIAALAEPFGIPNATIDGNDVAVVHQHAAEAVARARAGGGPTFLETRTQRYYGHTTGDMQVYRTREQIAELRARTDPLPRLRGTLQADYDVSDAALAAIDDSIEHEIQAAIDEALAGPAPNEADLFTDVWA
jgi:pyruvate dehydrogenase E1 component alpha subunit